jgi:predicted lipoprotein with Yx(FWY)xxD motif
MAPDFRRPTASRRLPAAVLSVIAVTGAAGLLAACGSSSTGGSASSGASSGGSTASTLSTRQLSGVGTALVNQSGATVYTPDQETGGKIHCTAACLSFWTPVTVSSTVKPTAPGGVTGTIGTIQRPDNGQMQVTFDGKPLYTFRLDHAPGEAHGQNFMDSFGSTSFTWRVVSTSGSATPGGSGGTTPSSPNYGSGGGGGGGGGY